MQLSAPFCLTSSGSDLAVVFVLTLAGTNLSESTRDMVVKKHKDSGAPLQRVYV